MNNKYFLLLIIQLILTMKNLIKLLLLVCVFTLPSFSSAELTAQSEPFVGQLSVFAGNFAPRGWAFCDGGLLPINEYQALFALIGTTYGGDGRNTFALPDLRGRVVIGPGHGPGLTSRSLGEKGGTEVGSKSGSGPFLTGGSSTKGVPNEQPYQVLNYIICLEGIFPSRS